MHTEESMIDYHELPEPLSSTEFIDLITKMNNGEAWARDKIILYNLRLVYFEINSKFNHISYDKNDLVSIGIIGLIKAVDSYDLNKGFKFATYAVRCIDNEILVFLRQLRKEKHNSSLNSIMFYLKEKEGAKLEEFLYDDFDLVAENERLETYNLIREVIQTLPERDRQIILLRFGFINDKIYTQKEIAQMLNLSQAQISRLIPKIINKIGTLIVENDIMETHSTLATIKKGRHLKKNNRNL